jgi:hypothetical protein
MTFQPLIGSTRPVAPVQAVAVSQPVKHAADQHLRLRVLVLDPAHVRAAVKPSRQAKGKKKAVRASSSRWGIGLVTLGFAMLWMWVKPFGFEKSAAELVVSMVLAPPSVVLAWYRGVVARGWIVEATLACVAASLPARLRLACGCLRAACLLAAGWPRCLSHLRNQRGTANSQLL